MTSAVKILEAALPQDQQQKKPGTIVIGTVEGDIHGIGKGIISYETIDTIIERLDETLSEVAREFSLNQRI